MWKYNEEYNESNVWIGDYRLTISHEANDLFIAIKIGSNDRANLVDVYDECASEKSPLQFLYKFRNIIPHRTYPEDRFALVLETTRKEEDDS